MVYVFLFKQSIFFNKMGQDLYYNSNKLTAVYKMNTVNIVVINRSISVKI